MRITGGELRSRQLRAPRGSATRPTSDRVREALFNVLASRALLHGARVLDLYAGTGALGLEAISRGAVHATLVEDARDALAAIRANVAALGVADRVRVVAARVERAARTLVPLSGAPFDLVFADPPYADVTSGEACRAIEAVVGAALAPGGTLVLEHAHADPPPALGGLRMDDARRYGDTALALYLRA
jgi:16S rRNA (guanine966-N2)-methyltransferase